MALFGDTLLYYIRLTHKTELEYEPRIGHVVVVRVVLAVHSYAEVELGQADVLVDVRRVQPAEFELTGGVAERLKFDVADLEAGYNFRLSQTLEPINRFTSLFFLSLPGSRLDKT